jgi:hypothetical protein
MPDPGEPHRPKRDHFASDEDYRAALDDYDQIMNPPQETETTRLSNRGISEIEQFLEDRSER